MGHPNKKIRLAILDAIIERQHAKGYPLQLRDLCPKLGEQYSKEDLVAAVQYLVNVELIDASDAANSPQKIVPLKYCDGGEFRLRVPRKGIQYFEAESEGFIRKIIKHLSSPKRIADIIQMAFAWAIGLLIGWLLYS